MAKVIIIGASSGIGHELATVFSEKGFELGLVARRLELLEDLKKTLKTKSYIRQVDLAQPGFAIRELDSLMQEMGSVDVFIINSGVFYNNPELNWEKDLKTIEVNVAGFSVMANYALTYFLKKGAGQLVGISSISALRGESISPAYSASKAYISNYLEGLRHRMAQEKKTIYITDIQPGWVETAMAIGENTFWMASKRVAALQIFSAIEKKRSHAYVTSRWRLYAWLIRLAPNWFYDKYL